MCYEEDSVSAVTVGRRASPRALPIVALERPQRMLCSVCASNARDALLSLNSIRGIESLVAIAAAGIAAATEPRNRRRVTSVIACKLFHPS